MEPNPYESPLTDTALFAQARNRRRLWIRLAGYGFLFAAACMVFEFALGAMCEDSFDLISVRMGYMLYSLVLEIGALVGLAVSFVGIVGWIVTAIS